MYNSQALQDQFVDLVLNSSLGYFIDIGAGTGGIKNQPIEFYSNTYFFEKYKYWDGLAIDYDKDYIDFAAKNRKCKCICIDLSKHNINDVLKEANVPNIVDYLSLDVDDVQEKVFNELCLSTFKFKVVTLEHNLFRSKQNQDEKQIIEFHKFSREKMLLHGYHLMCDNVILDGYGEFEDWYIHPDYVRVTQKFINENCSTIINKLRSQ
jgi:hypothetical protein